MSLITWVIYNYVGFKKHGIGSYFKTNLFPPGVPKPIYVIVAPIEFATVAVLRPVTLTIRLMANMMSGHLLLVLFFSATSFFLLESQGFFKAFAVPSYVMGLAFTLFEILIAFLQAYIFTLLTAVYIQMSLSEEH
jgi:F-type H+-transporting ATPase subunit a